MSDVPADDGGLFDAALVTPAVAVPARERKRRTRRRSKATPEDAEQKRATFAHATGAGMRVGGDHPVFHIISIVGTCIVAVASFTQSVFSQLAVAVWQRGPQEFHLLTPIMVDSPIVVFSAATIVFKAREQRAAKIVARCLAIGMTLLSAANNFLHTVEVAGGLHDYRDVIGASLNALSPVLVYACAEILGAIIVRPKPKDSVVARARAEAKRAKSDLSKARAELTATKKLVRRESQPVAPVVDA